VLIQIMPITFAYFRRKMYHRLLFLQTRLFPSPFTALYFDFCLLSFYFLFFIYIWIFELKLRFANLFLFLIFLLLLFF